MGWYTQNPALFFLWSSVYVYLTCISNMYFFIHSFIRAHCQSVSFSLFSSFYSKLGVWLEPIFEFSVYINLTEWNFNIFRCVYTNISIAQALYHLLSFPLLLKKKKKKMNQQQEQLTYQYCVYCEFCLCSRSPSYIAPSLS